jgi:hypothetical protein
MRETRERKQLEGAREVLTGPDDAVMLNIGSGRGLEIGKGETRSGWGTEI